MKEQTKRRLFQIVYTLIQWTWGIIQNTAALFVFLFVKLKDPKRAVSRYHGAVVTEWKLKSSMALGMFIFLGFQKDESPMARAVLAHEYGHTVQSCILGPFYIPVIGLPSLIWANVPAAGRKWRSGTCLYYDFYTERWADYEGERVLRTKTPGRMLRS